MVKYFLYIFFIIIFSIIIIKYNKYLLYVYIASIQFENGIVIDFLPFTISKVAFIAFIISFAYDYIYNSSKYIKKSYYSLTFIIICIFEIVYITINTLISINFSFSMNYYNTIIQNLVMVFLVSLYIMSHDNVNIEKCFIAYTIASIIIAIIGIFKIIAGENIIYIISNRLSPFGVPGDEAHFAAAMIPSISYLLYLLFIKGSKHRIIIFTSVFLLIFVILFSQTRSAWVATISLLLFYIYKTIKKNIKNLKFIFYSVFFIAIFLFIIYILSPSLILMIEHIIENRATGSLASGGSGRTQIWLYGIRMIKYNFLFGSGFMSFPEVFSKYYQSITINGIFNALYAGRDAHNIYLSTLIEAGVIGCIIYMIFYLYLINKSLKKIADSINITVISSFISYLIIGFFLNISMRKYFWIIIAYYVVIAEKKDRTCIRRS